MNRCDECQSIDCYGRQCFYRITIAFDLCAYGSHASHKNVDNHRNINGQHRPKQHMEKCESMLWCHTLPCLVRAIDTPLSVTIEWNPLRHWIFGDTWNRIPALSPSLPNLCLRFASDASNIIIATVTDDGFCHNLIIMNTDKKRQNKTKEKNETMSRCSRHFIESIVAASSSQQTIDNNNHNHFLFVVE